MPTGLIGTGLSRPGNIQPGGDLPAPSAAPYGRFVPVDRLDDYWVSVWSFMRRWVAGVGHLYLAEYDADGGLLALTELGTLAVVEAGWTRHSLHLGPNDQLGRLAWQLDTAKVKVVAWADGTPDITWDLDGWQVERGQLLTAYAPSPSELVDGAVDVTHIADDAITTPKLVAGAVVAGKIAAGAITTEKLAADAVIANVLNVGGTVEINEDGIAVTGGNIIVSNPGGTVIIDGLSNMFKIVATGTLTATAVNVASVTLSALGVYATVPAAVMLIYRPVDARRFAGPMAYSFGSVSPGTTSFTPEAVASLSLDGSGYLVVSLSNAIHSATHSVRYYILAEAGI